MVNNGNVLLVGRKIGANNREESDFTRRSLSRIMDETTLESKDGRRGWQSEAKTGSENDDGGGNGRERNKGWERRMGFVAGEVSVGSLKPLIAF